MISIKFLLNMLVLLTLAQFYNYFSFFRLHLFLVFIVVVVIGVVIGSLLAFRTTEFVIPNLEPRLCRPPNRPACFHDHLDDLVTYKTYSDIINYLNNPTTSGSTSSPSSRANNNERCNDNKSDDERNSLRRIATTSVNGQSPNGQDHQRKSLGRRFENMNGKIWASCDNLENGGAEDLIEPNEKTWSAGGSLGGGDEDESGGGCDLDSVEDDNESQSNSKVETYLDELTELFVRDYIMTWLSFLIWEKEKFSVMAKNEFRQILNILRKRLRRVDYVKLVSRDLIYRFNQHFLNVKRCSNLNEPFKLNYYEMDQEKERDHLRNIVEIFLLNTFPEKSYFRNNAVRYVVRELLVNGVLIPSIELVCDPDYLNQKLLDYMASRENVRNNLNNKFSHAATYEDFIRLIKSSNSVDELKQLHLKIMNEIMQATVINEFKSSSSLSSKSSSSSASLSQSQSASNNGVITCGSSSFFASFSVPKAHEESGSGYFLAGKPNSTSGVGSSATGSGGEKSTKAEQLRSRNLKIYIKQLQYAKMLCEKRMQRLNAQTANNKASSQSMFYDEDTSDLTFENKLKNRKIVPIETILSSSKGLSNFLKYLEHDGSDRLLRFWIDVEKLKNINAKKKYELANKIYEIYLNTYDSPVRDEIGKDLNKSMQLFLIGNNTDEGFFKAQDKIKTVLENEHYPSFIVTELYEKALEQIEDDEKTKHTEGKKKLPNVQSTQSFSQLKRGSSGDPNKAQVDSLVEKLEMKMSALNAFKSNGYQQCDSKLVEVLKNDIEKLKHDISIYETHIQKTELWCDNIGKWKTKVAGIRQPNLNSSASQSNLVVNLSATSPTSSGPEKSSSSESYYPLFEIHVELFDDETPTTSPSQFREGWVIYRSFRQFEALNEALYELIPAEVKAKFKRIPSSSALKQRNVRLDEERARQITAALDDYLRVISQHEKLAQSEALYTFLCPSPDYFKRSNSNHHPNSNDESLKQKDMNSADDDEYLDRLFSESYLKTLDATNAARDSIAEPFYYLFEELFEIKGVKKLLRKSFIVFVQLTYGANINRAIRERVYSVVLSDEYVSFYLKQFKDAYWKFDEKSGEYALIQWTPVVRSLEEKIKTKKLAKLKLIANIPEILSKLVGDKNSQIGIIQLFEIFQDKQLNKHLFYSILEMFILELFPEAHVKKQLMQTTTGF